MEMALEIDLLRSEVARLKAEHVESERQLAAAFDRIGAQHEEMAELETMKIMVDDVLVVNWIPLKNNDYRQALAQLVENAIQEYDDPAISLVAADRSREMEALRYAIRRSSETIEVLSRNKDAMVIAICNDVLYQNEAALRPTKPPKNKS